MVDFYGLQLQPAAPPALRSDDPRSPVRPLLMATLERMRPQPSPAALRRLGGEGDGAYLLPDDLAGIRACFSPGVSNVKTFEDGLADGFGIASHLCDPRSSPDRLRTPLRPGLQTFEAKWLGERDDDRTLSLPGWIQARCPDAGDDLILQMDIEGGEYGILLSVPEQTLLRFRMIVLEVHRLGSALNPAVLEQVIGPFFERISRHFTCVHAHPNNACGQVQIAGTGWNLPQMMEFTFLRNDRFQGCPPERLHAPLLPHPEDIVSNDLRKPPLFLSEAWLQAERPLPSRLRILEDSLAHERLQAGRQAAAAAATQADLLRMAQGLASRLSPAGDEAWTAASASPDLALGKPFELSSAYGGFPRRGTVAVAPALFFHTGLGERQFIRIDLGASHRLVGLEIENRRDGFQDRARMLVLIVHDTPVAPIGQAFPLPDTPAFARGQAPLRVVLPALSGRWVTLLSLADTALHLRALRLHGTPLD
jgi:hypothetical protein